MSQSWIRPYYNGTHRHTHANSGYCLTSTSLSAAASTLHMRLCLCNVLTSTSHIVTLEWFVMRIRFGRPVSSTSSSSIEPLNHSVLPEKLSMIYSILIGEECKTCPQTISHHGRMVNGGSKYTAIDTIGYRKSSQSVFFCARLQLHLQLTERERERDKRSDVKRFYFLHANRSHCIMTWVLLGVLDLCVCVCVLAM